MEKYIIYHNNRCSKSRAALEALNSKNAKVEIVSYMDDPLTFDQLQSVIDMLDIPAGELVRKNEKIWKEEFAGKELSEDELILTMIEHPRLMQRPIVVKQGKAVIAREEGAIEKL
jgi:arsenate reductase (glutaredoxin)